MEAQKHVDPVDPDSDPDPQHWFLQFLNAYIIISPLFSAESEQPASLDGSDWEVEEGGVQPHAPSHTQQEQP